ncbi:MAG: AMP-binding protein [Bdellovibrionales bacterium]|nr:AMP-binding protein [Bdellovibrionales bacterium]
MLRSAEKAEGEKSSVSSAGMAGRNPVETSRGNVDCVIEMSTEDVRSSSATACRRSPDTVVDTLLSRIEREPEAVLFAERQDDGSYTDVLAEDFYQRVRSGAHALAQLGVGFGDKVGIMLPNGVQWEVIQYSCLFRGGVVVGFDSRDNIGRLEKLIALAEIKVLVVPDERVLGRLSQRIREVVDTIVLIEPPAESSDPQIIHWKALCSESEATDFIDLRLPRPEELATIVFSSGTSSVQKGVAFTHADLARAVRMMSEHFNRSVDEGSRTLSWLPLAHLTQRMVNFSALYSNSPVFLVPEPGVISDALKEVRPSIFVGVPRVFEKVYNKIHSAVEQQSLISRTLFTLSLRIAEARFAAMEQGRDEGSLLRFTYQFFDKRIFRKIREGFGGEIRFLISGSAPISPSIVRFFHFIGMPLLEVYALTEQALPVAMNQPTSFRIGSVGRPLEPDNIVINENGEILLRRLTSIRLTGATDLGEDESTYYSTGDYGYLDEDGFLFLNGRASDWVKTSSGNRVFLSSVEKRVEAVPMVDSAIVIAEGRKCPVVLLSLDRKYLRAATGSATPEGLSVPQRLKISGELADAVRDLPQYERPACFAVLSRPFDSVTGELTVSLKPCRKVIAHTYTSAIEDIYRRLDAGHSDRLVWIDRRNCVRPFAN